MKRGTCRVGLEATLQVIAKQFDCTVEEAETALHEALADILAEQPVEYRDRIWGICARLP